MRFSFGEDSIKITLTSEQNWPNVFHVYTGSYKIFVQCHTIKISIVHHPQSVNYPFLGLVKSIQNHQVLASRYFIGSMSAASYSMLLLKIMNWVTFTKRRNLGFWKRRLMRSLSARIFRVVRLFKLARFDRGARSPHEKNSC